MSGAEYTIINFGKSNIFKIEDLPFQFELPDELDLILWDCDGWIVPVEVWLQNNRQVDWQKVKMGELTMSSLINAGLVDKWQISILKRIISCIFPPDIEISKLEDRYLFKNGGILNMDTYKRAIILVMAISEIASTGNNGFNLLEAINFLLDMPQGSDNSRALHMIEYLSYFGETFDMGDHMFNLEQILDVKSIMELFNSTGFDQFELSEEILNKQSSDHVLMNSSADNGRQYAKIDPMVIVTVLERVRDHIYRNVSLMLNFNGFDKYPESLQSTVRMLALK